MLMPLSPEARSIRWLSGPGRATRGRHGSLLFQLRGGSPRAGKATVLPVRLMVRASTAQRSRKRSSPAWGTTRVSGSADHASGSTYAGSR